VRRPRGVHGSLWGGEGGEGGAGPDRGMAAAGCRGSRPQDAGAGQTGMGNGARRQKRWKREQKGGWRDPVWVIVGIVRDEVPPDEPCFRADFVQSVSAGRM